MAIPSIRRCGPRVMMTRSLKVPGSPSSALMTSTRGRARSFGRNPHLPPAGNPAPPRPCCRYVASRRYRSLAKCVVRTVSMAACVSSSRELVEDPVDRLDRQVLVVLVVDLHHRRRAAGAQALHLRQGELPVRGRLPGPDAELLRYVLDQMLRPEEGARDVPADLHVVLSHGLPVEHRVEGGDSLDLGGGGAPPPAGE